MHNKLSRKVMQIDLPIVLSDKVETMSSRLGMNASSVVEQIIALCFDDYTQTELAEHVRLLSVDTNFADVA